MLVYQCNDPVPGIKYHVLRSYYVLHTHYVLRAVYYVLRTRAQYISLCPFFKNLANNASMHFLFRTRIVVWVCIGRSTVHHLPQCHLLYPGPPMCTTAFTIRRSHCPQACLDSVTRVPTNNTMCTKLHEIRWCQLPAATSRLHLGPCGSL